MTYEGARLKVLDIQRKAFAPYRNKQLECKDFTIISNNCWGGMIYESYNLKKLSPTVGLFFMAKDYINFIKHLDIYLGKPLNFINPVDSKYVAQLRYDRRFGQYPIGLIDDIEIMFLHYHSQAEVLEKWNRRIERINWGKMLIKFNDQNGCTIDEVKEFGDLPYKNKLFFTIKEWDLKTEDNKWYYKMPQRTKDNCITASHEPFGKNRNVDITSIINNL